MLLGALDREDLHTFLPAKVAAICAQLRDVDWSAYELGWHWLTDEVKMNVMDTETEPADQAGKQAEIHHHVADIHLLIEGKELIEYSVAKPDLSLFQPYDAENDCQFIANLPDAKQLVLSPSQFAVILPFEAHKPTCAVGAPARIRKVVLKVPAHYFQPSSN